MHPLCDAQPSVAMVTAYFCIKPFNALFFKNFYTVEEKLGADNDNEALDV